MFFNFNALDDYNFETFEIFPKLFHFFTKMGISIFIELYFYYIVILNNFYSL